MTASNQPNPEQQFVEQYVRESSRVKLSLLSHLPKIAEMIESLITVVKGGGTIYSCGNGGSACDAMHLTEELLGVYKRDRPGIRAHHLLDQGTITCWTNDRGFDTVFERQVRTLLTSNDAFIALSTSGKSPNILNAMKAANEIGAVTIALLGKGGGPAKELTPLHVVVDSTESNHIQEAHIAIIHMMCERLEDRIYPPARS